MLSSTTAVISPTIQCPQKSKPGPRSSSSALIICLLLPAYLPMIVLCIGLNPCHITYPFLILILIAEPVPSLLFITRPAPNLLLLAQRTSRPLPAPSSSPNHVLRIQTGVSEDPSMTSSSTGLGRYSGMSENLPDDYISPPTPALDKFPRFSPPEINNLTLHLPLTSA